MDKSSNSSGDSSAVSASTTSSTGNNNNGNRDHHYLRQINKLSHKISKPTTTTTSSVSAAAVNREIDHQSFPPPPLNQGNLHQHQPPVYNINKNDFRDVVQKLTGSPAHERISAPPQQPIHHPKPQQSSRLHRIRPPPLAHVINRPPGLLNDAHIPQGPNHHHNWGGGFVPRPTAPLSPLPPLPPVHAAAESPVSSYMRYLHNSMATFDSNRKEISGLSPLAPLVSPRWYQQQQQQQSENFPPLRNNARPPPPSASGTVSQAAPTQITATQSMGCLNSPKSPYGLLSPSILLSPTSGQLGFPVSTATVPLSSPKYKGH
ncbi:unnamed protein product [Cochlearia groenlandica]